MTDQETPTPSVGIIDLSEIRMHQENPNAHTVRGEHLVRTSMERYRFAEAGLLDKNNIIAAGNLRTEIAHDVLGADKAIVVDVDGNTPVFLRRKDVDVTTPQGMELAVALNRTAQESIYLDEEMVRSFHARGADMTLFYFPHEIALALDTEQAPSYDEGDFFDATTMGGSVTGEGKPTYLIYLSFSERRGFERMVRALSYGTRSYDGRKTVKTVAFAGDEYIDRWEQSLIDEGSE